TSRPFSASSWCRIRSAAFWARGWAAGSSKQPGAMTGCSSPTSCCACLPRSCTCRSATRRGCLPARRPDGSAQSSAAHRAQGVGRIALARRRARRNDAIDAREILRRELHVERAQILFEILAALRARDGNDVAALRKHPCQCQLRRRAVLLGRDPVDLIDELQVLREIVSLESR